MKKNISINISGIIFHIEEDGYEKLKNYLESINRYFSSFEDSLEIISDIESRIAEIFLSKLKDGQQVVTLEDVEALMATMGSIKDFQAAEEESSYIGVADQAGEEDRDQAEEPAESEQMFARKLYRDRKRKLLGGVLAGIAHYFNIDPLWIRLLYVLLFFGISVLPSIAGFLFVAYVVLWIVIPESEDLTEERKIKKMYRNPDDKVLGGVASGVAAYFGVDVVVVRLLFVAGIFVAGIGLILYVILWIILPEAKTITDKMEMKGQPVTLSNIERNIKKSLKVEGKEENIFLKILLFPFRLIAAVIDFLSGAFGPILSFLAEAARIILGIIMILIGFSGIVAVIVTLGVLIGLFSQGGFQGDFFVIEGVPFDVIRQDFRIIPTLGLALVIMIPMLSLALAGVAVIIKKMVVKARVGWLLLALWLMSVVLVAITARPVAKAFRTKATVTEVRRYDPAGETLVFEVAEDDAAQRILDEVSISLRAAEDDQVTINEVYEASGADREKAMQNARMVRYGVQVSDSAFVFDRYLQFEEDGRFRLQQLDITVYVPEGRPFILDPSMRHLLGSYLYRQGYSSADMEDNTWQFDSLGLQCITCPPDETGHHNDRDPSAIQDIFGDIEGYSRTFDIRDFKSIEINSPFEVMITNSRPYSIVLSGSKETINEIVVDKTGDILSVDFKSGTFDWNKLGESSAVKVLISAPQIDRMEFGGACKATLVDLEGSKLQLEMSGAAYADADLQIEELTLDMKGAAKMDLHGTGTYMECKLSGAASLNAYEYACKNAEVYARTASTGKINAGNSLEVDVTGSSKVMYRGNPKIEVRKSNNARVEPES